MINLLIQRSKAEVGSVYYRDEEEYMGRKKIVTLPPSYTQAPGLTCSHSSVAIHKGIEVVVIRVCPMVSAVSIQLDKLVDWAVIDHMFWGVTSPTDLKIADIVEVSPLMTEITLGLQTMMCCIAQYDLLTG